MITIQNYVQHISTHKLGANKTIMWLFYGTHDLILFVLFNFFISTHEQLERLSLLKSLPAYWAPMATHFASC